MNDEDMRVCSYIFKKKCMLVLSAKVGNFEIKACMFIPKTCDQFPSLTRCSNEWVQLHKVKISNNYEIYYFQKTNTIENEIHMNLRDLIDNGKLSIIALQNDHYNAIISRNKQLQCVPTWPRMVSFDLWKSASHSSSLCHVCNSPDENSFV